MTRPRRVVTIPAYWIALVLLTVAVAPVFGGWVSIQLADENARRLQAEQRAVDRQVQAEGRRLACEQFSRLIDAWDPTRSAVGRDVRDVYVFLYTLIQCHPPRK